MKWTVALCAVFTFSVLSFNLPSHAETNQLTIRADALDSDNGAASRLSAEDRAQSDALMKSGLAKLQSAASALQSNDVQDALQYMRSAVVDMKQAKPIYHGHRDAAVEDTTKAGRWLDANRPLSVQRATVLLSDAIAQAQIAVNNW